MPSAEFMRFVAVGVASFLVDFGLLYVFHGRLHVVLWLAAGLAFSASMVVNFFLNRIFTFGSSGRLHAESARYLCLVLLSLGATVLLVTGFTRLGCPYLVSKALSTTILAIVNFFVYRRWVFTAASQPRGEGVPTT
jgi:putative flippase GtrA